MKLSAIDSYSLLVYLFLKDKHFYHFLPLEGFNNLISQVPTFPTLDSVMQYAQLDFYYKIINDLLFQECLSPGFFFFCMMILLGCYRCRLLLSNYPYPEPIWAIVCLSCMYSCSTSRSHRNQTDNEKKKNETRRDAMRWFYIFVYQTSYVMSSLINTKQRHHICVWGEIWSKFREKYKIMGSDSKPRLGARE